MDDTHKFKSEVLDSGIQYLMACFVDIWGSLRSKLIPIQQIDRLTSHSIKFSAFGIFNKTSASSADMIAIPDYNTFQKLPWRQEVGWVICDLVLDGKVFEQNPRQVLKTQLEHLHADRYKLMCGVEPEFFLLEKGQRTIADVLDTEWESSYSATALLRNSEFCREVGDCMTRLGWSPYQLDHEHDNGQYEFCWEYDDALTTADRTVLFKFMVKEIAEKYGLQATFMPKPFSHLAGNGMHVHASLWKTDANCGRLANAFLDSNGKCGLSQLGHNFIGGILHHAKALTALFCPTVNSYKRLQWPSLGNGPRPKTISYTGNNRTHIIRIPDGHRIELRFPDGAANPYLLCAGIAAAGRHGIQSKLNSELLWRDTNSLKQHDASLDTLPTNLLDALRELEHDTYLSAAFGSDFVTAFQKLKAQEWAAYMQQVSTWEWNRFINC